MSRLPPSAIQALVHEALAARVRVLLSQSSFDELLATQERVSQELAAGIAHLHAPFAEDAPPLKQMVLEAFAMDASYYVSSSLDFIISDALVTAGLALADAVRGRESDSRARWQRNVVPELDRIEEFVVSVLDGRWSAQPQAQRVPLVTWLRR